MTKFSSSIEISAPVKGVFSALCDLPQYENWHPSVRSAVLESGNEGGGGYSDTQQPFHLADWLILDLGSKNQSVKVPVIVTKLENNKVLEWQGSLFRKGAFRQLFLVRHAFYVKDIGNGVTLFTNEEEFHALLSFPVSLAREKFLFGYDQVNHALKGYCEK